MERVSRWELGLLTLALLVGLAVRLHFYTGLLVSDDVEQGYTAAHFMSGPETNDPWEPHPPGVDTVNGRRIGVNLPLYLAAKLRGASETSFAAVPLLFSLAGIAIVFLLSRRLGGPLAGATAAWMWAVLPGDVYTATVWLQDNIYATVLAGFLALLVAAETGGRRPRALALGAGFVWGYLCYVKESGFFLLLPLAVWAVWTCMRAHRLEGRVLALAAGFVAAHLVAMLYFWHAAGAPFYYLTETWNHYVYIAGSYHGSHPFPDNWRMMSQYLFEDWVFGYGVWLVPVLGGLMLLRRDIPRRLRVTIGLIFLLELWALSAALTLGNWTQRYTLQLSAPVVLLAAVGLATAVERIPAHALARLPSRLRPLVGPAMAACLILVTGTALAGESQQLTPDRAAPLRDAFRYLERVVAPDETVYADLSDQMPNYTRRGLALLNHYRRFKGGLGPLEEAYHVTSGWVILTDFDRAHADTRTDSAFHGVPDTWLEVFQSANHRGRRFARVYRILRAAPHPPVEIVATEHTVPAVDPASLPLRPVDLAGPVESLRTHHFTRNTRMALRRTGDGGVAASVAAVGGHGPALAALAFPVADGLDALSFDLVLDRPASVRDIFVYAFDATGKRSMRWKAYLPRRQRAAYPRHVFLVSGEPAPPFKHLPGSLPLFSVRQLIIGVWLDPAAAVDMRLSHLQIAAPPAQLR